MFLGDHVCTINAQNATALELGLMAALAYT